MAASRHWPPTLAAALAAAHAPTPGSAAAFLDTSGTVAATAALSAAGGCAWETLNAAYASTASLESIGIPDYTDAVTPGAMPGAGGGAFLRALPSGVDLSLGGPAAERLAFDELVCFAALAVALPARFGSPAAPLHHRPPTGLLRLSPAPLPPPPAVGGGVGASSSLSSPPSSPSMTSSSLSSSVAQSLLLPYALAAATEGAAALQRFEATAPNGALIQSAAAESLAGAAAGFTAGVAAGEGLLGLLGLFRHLREGPSHAASTSGAASPEGSEVVRRRARAAALGATPVDGYVFDGGDGAVGLAAAARKARGGGRKAKANDFAARLLGGGELTIGRHSGAHSGEHGCETAVHRLPAPVAALLRSYGDRLGAALGSDGASSRGKGGKAKAVVGARAVASASASFGKASVATALDTAPLPAAAPPAALPAYRHPRGDRPELEALGFVWRSPRRQRPEATLETAEEREAEQLMFGGEGAESAAETDDAAPSSESAPSPWAGAVGVTAKGQKVGSLWKMLAAHGGGLTHGAEQAAAGATATTLSTTLSATSPATMLTNLSSPARSAVRGPPFRPLFAGSVDLRAQPEPSALNGGGSSDGSSDGSDLIPLAPLVVAFDVEATGLTPGTDKVTQLAARVIVPGRKHSQAPTSNPRGSSNCGGGSSSSSGGSSSGSDGSNDDSEHDHDVPGWLPAENVAGAAALFGFGGASFSRFVDPGVPIDPFISQLTGMRQGP